MIRLRTAIAVLLTTLLIAGCDDSPDDAASLSRDLLTYQSKVREDFAAERQRLDARSSAIDAEARQLSDQRHRDPLVAAAVTEVGSLLTATLPLAALVLLLGLAFRNERTGELDSADPVELLVLQTYAAEPAGLLRAPRTSEPPRHLANGPDSGPTAGSAPSDPPKTS